MWGRVFIGCLLALLISVPQFAIAQASDTGQSAAGQSPSGQSPSGQSSSGQSTVGQATAQSLGFVTGRVQSPVLTIESDRLFADSAFGRRIAREIEAERATIARENDQITAELEAEEQELTDLRATMAAEEFRTLADAFDEKVQRLRREQDEKARALGTRSEEARRRFVAAAQPVIEAIMRDTGAALIVERRIVFISADVIDITDAAIARIDAAIGDGMP